MPKLPPKVMVSVLSTILSLSTYAGEMNCPPNEYLQTSARLLIFKDKTPVTDTLYDYRWNGLNWALLVEASANNDKDALHLAKRKLATHYWAHIWSTENVCRYFGNLGMVEVRSYVHTAELK